MGFTKTAEGRVFFKNADNDDTPNVTKYKPALSSGDSVMPADSTQMQILLLLKSLNSKLKNSKSDQGAIKKQLEQYRATIKNLEAKTLEQETNYIDLEQKISQKQNEVSKRAARVENSVKNTLKQLKEAKELVKELEEKAELRGETLEELRGELKDSLKKQQEEQNKKNEAIIKRQKSLAAVQKQQGEKMVDNVAAYVSLTKRVSDTETKYEVLDNKIEDTKSDYLKLDRKIEKAIEERNRILRKVDRIEQAVLETRDALNAKAMVLLTDQGAVAGINMPQISDDTLQTDPMLLSRRLQEEALMPWWRRPIRIQATSLVLMMIVVLLLGWILNGANSPAPVVDTQTAALTDNLPTISLHTPKAENPQVLQQNYIEPDERLDNYDIADHVVEETPVQEEITLPKNVDSPNDSHGITIHKGYSDPSQINSNANNDVINDIETLDINNEEEMLAVLEADPDRVARRLNKIEPSSLTTQDKVEPPKKRQVQKTVKTIPDIGKANIQNNKEYIAALKRRISPDPNLTGVAKKIETQAFQGIAEAQHDMGAIYVAGHGQIKKDLKRAVLWFKEAAANGIANAKYNLGVLYHQGLGVEQDITRAMDLYKQAANLGHPEAQYNLGIAYIEGIGVAYDPKQATSFFEAAANNGVVEAAYNLGLIYENGLLGETQPDNALAWYKKAADQGSPEASSALKQLANSLGITIDDVDLIIESLLETSSQDALSADMQNYIISQIQTELMDRGLYPGPIDGVNGPMTENAIKQFQASVDLNIDGKPSQELLNYMRNAYEYR